MSEARRYVIVSTTNSIDYFFYAPFIERAWKKFGWDLCVVITEDVVISDLKLSNEAIIIRMPKIEGLRDASIAQAGRLYAASIFPDETLLMTSDMDLLPLSDYWNPDPNDITVYGHDLTWRSFYPMGYIAMSAGKWKEYMNLTGEADKDLLRDAKDETIPHSPLSNDWEQWWNFDWSLVTERLKPHKDKIKFIDRGQIDIAGATLAKGRIDRYNVSVTREQPEPMIDMHCENNNVLHESKLIPFMEIFTKYIGTL